MRVSSCAALIAFLALEAWSQPDPCNIPGLPAPANAAPQLLIGPQMTAGIFDGSTVDLPPGVTVNVTGDLTIVGKGRVTIAGAIHLPPNVKADLTIVSLDGTVRITKSAFVGGGSGAAGQDGETGGPGQDGGVIIVSAPHGAIEIQGVVVGAEGGRGGSGSEIGLQGALVPRIDGGKAGGGSSVLFCAIDGINISGRVEGGTGGRGGKATHAPFLAPAVAQAGRGGDGGFVRFIDPSGNAMIVNITGRVAAGSGGPGGDASASVPDPNGSATALGGPAGAGGVVNFFGVLVTAAPQSVVAGGGMKGGRAQAEGSNAITEVQPEPGGNADARGGQGGTAGQTPVWIDGQTLSIITGTAARHGSGGDAKAIAGKGGDAKAPGVAGARSGTAKAVGGPNGANIPVPAGPVIVGPSPAKKAIGGVAVTAKQNGQP